MVAGSPPPSPRVPYDLLLKNGRVLDPGQGLDTRLDIAVTGRTIAEVAPQIPAEKARQVLDLSGPGRYVVPGLIDVHAHVGRGATTPGVGMGCCDPDEIGVASGVTTVVDAGSVGIANLGTFPVHILPGARTRVLVYVNFGTFAHTMPGRPDITSLDEIDVNGIRSCIEHNPGLVSGVKLRLVGPLMTQAGEQVVRAAKAVTREAGIPLMVHIGDATASGEQQERRLLEVTGFLLTQLEAGDILTHLCTPAAGGVGHAAGRLGEALREARARGVILDAALGLSNFGYRVAREQYECGLHPDTISSDLTLPGQAFHSLLECMAKFMAVGYSLTDVVRMTTAAAAQAIGLAGVAGAIAVGREADLTMLDVVEEGFTFTDSRRERFTGSHGLKPVHTIRVGRLVPPRWGTHPWGWLPEPADGTAVVTSSGGL